MTRAAVHHPLFARAYARLAPRAESRGVAEHRALLLAGLTGRVLEVGCGPGLNFTHYPPAVSEVIALEPEAHLRRLAIEAAATAPVPVQVVDGIGEAIPVPGATVDAAVVALVLCSVRDPGQVLAELRRVLVPGGQLRYYEHVLAAGPAARAVQRVMDATVWPRAAAGCHLTRDTGTLIRDAGFTVADERTLTVEAGVLAGLVPHLLGFATLRS